LVVSSFCPSVSWMVPSAGRGQSGLELVRPIRETMITVRQLPGADLQLSEEVAHPANERSVLGQARHPVALRAGTTLIAGRITGGRGANTFNWVRIGVTAESMASANSREPSASRSVPPESSLVPFNAVTSHYGAVPYRFGFARTPRPRARYPN
jgi:hypothetical protein